MNQLSTADRTRVLACLVEGNSQRATVRMTGIATRLCNRVQLSSDGHKAYLTAVEAAWAFRDVDYGMLVKIYGDSTPSGRYSPGEVIGTRREAISGQPDTSLICTSHVERQNLTMRMSMRRFTRLTNAFSKKFENHRLAVALHFIHYNFCRIHQSLRVTPAMAAGLSDHVWSLAELVGLMGSQPQEAVLV